MKEIRKRLTYANVMSSLAVFMVLGGGAAVAANGGLPKGSVGTPQLKKNAVKTPKIAPSAVKTGKLGKQAVKAGKLANGAVVTGKIGDGAVATSKLANGAVTGEKANLSTFGKVPSAAHADTATTSAPRAYARVLNNTGGLGVDPARSKGVTAANVTFVAGSVYCFSLDFTPRNIQTTVDWIGGGGNTFAHATLEPFAVCPAGTNASVRTTSNAGAGIGTTNFYVQFVD